MIFSVIPLSFSIYMYRF